jgi:hypothetical protein
VKVLYAVTFALTSIGCLWLTGSWIAAVAAGAIITALVAVVMQ